MTGEGNRPMDEKKNDKTPAEQDKAAVWDKINDEAEMLRRRTTPVYMKQRIMDALPEAPEPAKPWYKKVLDK